VTVLADHQGHDLTLGLVVLSLEVLTRWPGSVTSLMSQAVRVPLVTHGIGVDVTRRRDVTRGIDAK
jgi:hypothetical protein